MKDFRKLRIWTQGVELAVKGYELSKIFPKEEMFGLRSQITRAVVSIPSNIAEGCSRSSEREFARFLEIALGSSFELETDLIIAEKLKYVSPGALNAYMDLLSTEQKQINTLLSKLR